MHLAWHLASTQTKQLAHTATWWQEPREASPMRAEAHRRALYPDATGVATKVGYKRARDGEEPPSPPDLSADL